MQSSTLSLFFTCATCCLYASLAFPLDDLDALDTERLERELAAAADPGNMSPSDLRNLLLKKLRFREIVGDEMLSPEEIVEAQKSLESEERHGHHKDYHKPDIVVGTESWLHKDIPDCGVFPSFLGYNPPIRRDRPGDTKGGGVFILVSQRLVVCEQPQLSTDCKTVWAKVQVVEAKPLLIAAYYRPSEHDQKSAEEFKNSLALIDTSKSHMWVLGDFNYPKLNWEENQPVLKQNCPNPEMYQDFAAALDDQIQIHECPSPGENPNPAPGMRYRSLLSKAC